MASTTLFLLLVGIYCLTPGSSFKFPKAQSPVRLADLESDVIRFRCKGVPLAVVDAGEDSRCVGLTQDMKLHDDQYWSISNNYIPSNAKQIYCACDRGEWKEDENGFMSKYFPILKGNSKWEAVMSFKCTKVFWDHKPNPCLGEANQLKGLKPDSNGDIIVCVTHKKT